MTALLQKTTRKSRCTENAAVHYVGRGLWRVDRAVTERGHVLRRRENGATWVGSGWKLNPFETNGAA